MSNVQSRHSALSIGHIGHSTFGIGVYLAVTVLAFALVPFASTAPFVSESTEEFHATGDFDGDGRLDIVIVDKATGTYRLGFQLAANVFTWVSARASGVENVTGMSLGRLLDLNRDALMLTAPGANRVNVFDLSSPTLAGAPIPIFPGAIGPNLVVALDIGGAGNTAHHDTMVGSIWNNAPNNQRLDRFRNNGVTFTELVPGLQPAVPLARGNRVKIKSTAVDMMAVVTRGSAASGLEVYDASSGTAALKAQVATLPVDVDYVTAAFASGSPYSQFVFIQPGQSSLRVRAIVEPSAGTFAFGAETVFPLGQPVRQAFVLPGASDTKLLVLFGQGDTGAVYSFNGTAAPTAIQAVTVPPGSVLTGAASLENGAFLAFSGDPATRRSVQSQRWTFAAGAYTAGSVTALPAVNELSGTANVLYFQGEPLVTTSPQLRGTRRAGDWTSLFNLNVPQVVAESFVNSGAGLDNPVSVNLGSLPALTTFGLVNQSPFGPLSMFSLASPIGEEVIDLTATPPAGVYRNSVLVKLTQNPPNAANPIFYRTTFTGSWLPYPPGTSIPIFQDTTLYFYAQVGLTPKKSVVHQAAYQFPKKPEQMDSDGDGVPDFVEIAKGLNPNSGSDADADTFSDLCELLSGTDAANAASHPAVPCGQEAAPAQLVVGVTFQRQPAQVLPCLGGTLLRAFDLNGSLLSATQATTLNIAGATDPAARLSITADQQTSLAIVATDPHFDLGGGLPDPKVGRELLGLLPVPRVIGGVAVSYTHGGGPNNVEAAGWIQAAQSAYTAAAGLKTVANLDLHDTLVALLVERRLQDELLARGHDTFAGLTLFPFRAGDAGRPNPTLPLILALENLSNGFPGLRLSDAYQKLQSAVNAPDPNPFAELKAVTAEIYRISSQLQNAAAPGTYAPPVDVLRAFRDGGVLPPAYVNATTLTGAQLAAAFNEVPALLALAVGRPTQTTTLVVRPDSFAGPCTILDPPGGASTVSLWHRDGVPYNLLEAFVLPVGSQLQVFGYSDVALLGCGASGLEVITLTLGSVPPVSAIDSDGDLLADALELLLFGTLGQNGLSDFDNDGFSNLQEVLDGTDPKNPQSKGFIPVNLSPPVLQLQTLGGGQLQLNFSFPAAYASKLNFGVLSAAELGGEFAPINIVPVNVGGNQFQVILPNPGMATQFYIVIMGLK